MFVPRLPGFSISKQLGQGSYGTVYKVKRISDGCSYALKVVDLSSLNQKQREDSVNEIRIMASIDSPFIIGFHEAFCIERKLYLISEYAKLGDLSHAIARRKTKNRPFKEETIWRFFLQALEGLNVLHDQGIVHRDLKSANILLSAPDLFKIGDLGISTVLSQKELAKTQIGTPMYLAPEIWRGKPYDSKCDVWSLGVLLYEMATFTYPYTARNARDLSVKVCSGRLPANIKRYSNDLMHIINSMLSNNPISRPSVASLLSNHVIVEKKGLISPFIQAVEQSNANLLDTIIVPRNLNNLNLPRPRYDKHPEVLVPIEQRLHVKGQKASSMTKLSLVSTKELQIITDMDSWSPTKEGRDLRRDQNDENQDELFTPRPPSNNIPTGRSIRPGSNGSRRSVAVKVAPPLDAPSSQRNPPKRMRFRYRPPLVIR